MAKRLEPGQFYGKVADQRVCAGTLVSELLHPARTRLPSHQHEHAYICMLSAGTYRERWGRRKILYEPFTTVVHPEGFCHQDEIGPSGGGFLMVEIPSADFAKAGLPAPRDVRIDVCHGALSRAAIRLFVAHRLGDPLDTPLVELMGETAAPPGLTEKVRPQWLARVTAMLRESCSEPLTLQSLAAIAGVHPVHVSRTFERFEGCAVSERLRSLRVQKAMREIADGHSTLAEAAVAAGFADQSHMTRVFQGTLRMTPGRFRSVAHRIGLRH
jgi:AraC family transcriptional regulator